MENQNQQNYLIIDLETVPLNEEHYEKLDEEEQKKLLNPIDSKIIAIGLKHNGKEYIFMSDNEKEVLTQFWKTFEELREQGKQIVGFNIANFDLPFLTTRSFVNNVKIVPFTLKFVLDLRDKVTAYRFGPTRGTLKDFAQAMGLENKGDGSQVFDLYKKKDWKTLQIYLEHDLFITDEMYKRLKALDILKVQKW